MWKLFCPICYSTWSPDAAKELRSLACGHVFCEGCILRHFETCENREDDPNCPSCRDFATEDDMRPIYFELDNEDGTQPQAGPSGPNPGIMQHLNYVKKGLQTIEPGTAERSVKRTGDKIQEIIDSGDMAAQSEILTEVASFFKQRVVPVFREIVQKRDQLARLQERVEAVQAEKEELRRTVRSDRQTATNSKARMEVKMQDLQDTNAQLLTELERLRADKVDRDALEEDNRSYKGQLDNLKQTELLLKADNKALKAKNKQQKQEIQKLKAEISRPHHEEQSLVIQHEPLDDDGNHFLDYILDAHRPHKRRKLGDLDFNAEESPSSDTYDLEFSSPSPAVKLHRQRYPSPVGPQGAQKRSFFRPAHLSAPSQQPQPTKPKFKSEWSLPAPAPARIRKPANDIAKLPFPVDAEGKMDIKKLQPASRVRMGNFK